MFNRKHKGQAMLVIAGSIIALLALVALAVDGGNAYAQRRIAQNATDAAAIAGITTLGQIFQANRYSDANGVHVGPITTDQQQTIINAIRAVLAANNGVDALQSTNGGSFQAWYLGQDGQKFGTNQVGALTSVPFADGQNNGAQGLYIVTTASSETYFARVVGISRVTADANTTAMMGSVSSITRNASHGRTSGKLWPITIFSDTIHAAPGQTTSLYDFDDKYGPGNWGIVCYQGVHCGNDDVKEQFLNGFDPSTGVDLFKEVQNGGPTSVGDDAHYNFYPVGNDGDSSHSAWSTGVWQPVHTGNPVSASCDTLQTAAAEHWQVFMPISNRDNGGNGANNRFHVINIAGFIIQSVDCPGNANKIVGTFTGYGWSASNTSW